jgi:ribonuclease-3
VPLLNRKKNGTFLLNKREFQFRLKKLLGFTPGNLRIYEIAFIHRSASLTLDNGEKINNERLEFLGDSVLDGILSGYLFEKYPDASEGFMTKIRARVANREFLNQLALSMGIDELLVSNLSSGHVSRHLYGDAFEALIGAIFIDRGFRRTKMFFMKNVLGKYLDLDNIIKTDNDYKSLVFEWVQKHKATLNFIYNEEYNFEMKMSVFTTTLLIDKVEYGKGQGASKKEAEQEASGQAWAKLKDISEQSE